MPKQLSKSDMLRLKLGGAKFDDGSDIDLRDDDEEAEDDPVGAALADLAEKTARMTAAITELNRIVGNSLVSLADIVEAQSKSISALADGLAKISKTEPVIQKPRSCVFDVQRENGRICSVTMKEK